MTLINFKALADETRLRLARILFHYELSVNELVQILDMGQSRVSRHLKILTEAGLLKFRRNGLWVFYSAPVKGRQFEFLRAIMPFMESSPQMEADLKLAGQMLEERSRRTQQFFNSIAESWDDLNQEILGDFNLPERVLAAMPANCSVAVDLGCGTGAVLEYIMPRTKLAIGVDGSARMLELCRARIGGSELASGHCSLRIGELSHLPLADHEADFACINLVLHHLARPEDIFREIQRILTPGGILFIAEFHSHNDEEMRSRYGDHWLGFEMKELEKSIVGCGFEIAGRENQPVGKGLKLCLLRAKSRGQAGR